VSFGLVVSVVCVVLCSVGLVEEGGRTYYRNRKLSIRQEFREKDISTGAHLCNIIHPEISRRDIYVPFRPEKSIPCFCLLVGSVYIRSVAES